MSTLWVSAGPNVGARFALEQEITLGRSSTCEVVLHDRRVSRRHAQIRPKDSGFEVVDLGSRNGISLNGKRVEKTAPLASGDRLQVGSTYFVFDPPPLFELGWGQQTLSLPEKGVVGWESAAKLEQAVLGWSNAPTPAAILRLGLASIGAALGAARADLLRFGQDPAAIELVGRWGKGTPKLPRALFDGFRAGKPGGTAKLLGAPLGVESLVLVVERESGSYGVLDLALCASAATLCGRCWQGARDSLRGEGDPALGLWDERPSAFGPVLRKLFDRVVEAAPHQSPVLFLGEGATGRRTSAFLLHAKGRAGNPFAAPRSAQVAATGWAQWLARAEGGTLYLGDLASLHDPKGLTAALAELEGNAPQDPRLPAPVRLVAGSQVDLEDLVEEGRLPLVLAERFAGSVIRTPPLRELRSDLPALIARILPEVARQVGRPVPRISAEAMELMQAYRWPGNLAELSSCLAALVLAARDMAVDAPALPTAIRLGPSAGEVGPTGSLGELVEHVERTAIASALRAAGYKKLHAAKALGISRPTLDKKIAQYGLKLGPR
jgi:hypothetical protein